MAGKTLDIGSVIVPDQLGTEIARMWHSWDSGRDKWKREKIEVRQFVYATDTTVTSAQTLPWNNKTHIPKLCQIRDNLFANYVASMFPKRKWLIWEGNTKDDQQENKQEAIRDYMSWVISQKSFKDEVYKLILDYIDYGNCFATVDWADETSMASGFLTPGYVGPKIKRINPLDIVINPMAPSVKQSPKIVRALWTKGELKKLLNQETSTPEETEVADEVWKYIMEVRNSFRHAGEGADKELDEYYRVDGFQNFQHYLDSDYIETLTFYGDLYDDHNEELLENYIITVVDRHKVIYKKPHPMRIGEIPIYHSGWRVRQDNLWAMGPLDNLVGMQYRIDHVENLKADIFDLTVFPPMKIKGQVEDFEWGPFERIYVDQEGDVELMSPKADILTANVEIQGYEQRMEEMAGSPKEAMGFRTPGEKTAYEVQRLENAASRIFQSKITQFEEQILEPLLNAMLGLARNNLTDATIRVIDDEFKSVEFKSLTREDLSALGRIKPVAARHFAERAELVQNLNNFFTSAIGADPEIKQHWSAIKLSEMFEEVLGLEDYEIVQAFIRLSEQADAQRLASANEEAVMTEIGTPAGIAQDDVG